MKISDELQSQLNPPRTKVNFGCSGIKKEGYINVDWQSLVKPDLEHDLNSFPYPFADSSVDVIEASHVIEHLDRPFAVMKEFHRILKDGGKLVVKVPHFSRAMTHPEHFHGFDVTFPNYLNPKFSGGGYYGFEFELQEMKLKWTAFPHILEGMGYSKVAVFTAQSVNNILSFLANLSPNLCSRIWCFWVGGFEEIGFVFLKKK